MKKKIWYIIFIILFGILIYNKINGKKGTWDSKEEIEEYAILSGNIYKEKNSKKKSKNNKEKQINLDLEDYTPEVNIISSKPKRIKGLSDNFRAIDMKSSFRISNIIKEKYNKLDNSKDSLGEVICRKYAEHVFKKPFPKIRHSFLKNPVTLSNLELDCYCEDLNLAIEYNGMQHYKFVPRFHNNKQDFYNQQYRDRIKKEVCMKNGIHLIDVPYTVHHDTIPLYMEAAFKKLSFI